MLKGEEYPVSLCAVLNGRTDLSWCLSSVEMPKPLKVAT